MQSTCPIRRCRVFRHAALGPTSGAERFPSIRKTARASSRMGGSEWSRPWPESPSRRGRGSRDREPGEMELHRHRHLPEPARDPFVHRRRGRFRYRDSEHVRHPPREPSSRRTPAETRREAIASRRGFAGPRPAYLPEISPFAVSPHFAHSLERIRLSAVRALMGGASRICLATWPSDASFPGNFRRRERRPLEQSRPGNRILDLRPRRPRMAGPASGSAFRFSRRLRSRLRRFPSEDGFDGSSHPKR